MKRIALLLTALLFSFTALAVPYVTIATNETHIVVGQDPSLIIGTNPPVGQAYTIAPGTYTCSTWFAAPTNGSIKGGGRGTVLINNYTNAANLPYPLIAQADGSSVSDLVISNFYRGNGAAGIYQACLGAHPNIQPAFNGAIAERVLMYGGTDAYYVRGGNASKGSLISCVITSSWDCSVFIGAAHQFELWNCTLATVSPTYSGASKQSCIGFDQATGAYVRANNCNFYGANTLSRAGDDGSGGCTLEVNGGVITNSYSVDFSFQFSTSSLRVNYLAGYNPTKVSENVNNGRSLFYSPVVSTNFTFGGTADDGNGPILSSTFPRENAVTLSAASLLRVTPLQTLQGNRAAPSSISVTASPFNWTNTATYNQQVFIIGGTISAIAINGTTLWTAAGNTSFVLQTNEWTTVTYTVAPTMKSKPF